MCLYFAEYLSRDCHSGYNLIRAAGNPVPKRLARFLIDSCADGRMSDGVVRATVALTHEAIAERIGCSRETVCRALSDRNEGTLRNLLASLCGCTIAPP